VGGDAEETGSELGDAGGAGDGVVVQAGADGCCARGEDAGGGDGGGDGAEGIGSGGEALCGSGNGGVFWVGRRGKCAA
jgi:hypothetical protein